jgi:hypothetical protein
MLVSERPSESNHRIIESSADFMQALRHYLLAVRFFTRIPIWAD